MFFLTFLGFDRDSRVVPAFSVISYHLMPVMPVHFSFRPDPPTSQEKRRTTEASGAPHDWPSGRGQHLPVARRGEFRSAADVPSAVPWNLSRCFGRGPLGVPKWTGPLAPFEARNGREWGYLHLEKKTMLKPRNSPTRKALFDSMRHGGRGLGPSDDVRRIDT